MFGLVRRAIVDLEVRILHDAAKERRGVGKLEAAFVYGQTLDAENQAVHVPFASDGEVDRRVRLMEAFFGLRVAQL